MAFEVLKCSNSTLELAIAYPGEWSLGHWIPLESWWIRKLQKKLQQNGETTMHKIMCPKIG